MTLRLVLVGLVAALGLTIPKLSNEMNRIDSARTVAVGPIKSRSVKTAHPAVRVNSRDRRFANHSQIVGQKKIQPTQFGAGVVRPAQKTASNFWHLPNGPRPVVTSSPMVVSSPTAQAARTIAEPVQLAVEIQGPPARLKVAKAETPSFRSPEYEISVTRAIVSLVEQRARFEPTRTTVAGATETKLLADKTAGLVLFGQMKSDFEGLAVNLSLRIVQSGRMVWETTKFIRAGALAAMPPKVQVVVAASKPLVAELATFPDDVFAADVREQVALAALPADIFAAAPDQVTLAALPDDVFAGEPRVEVALAAFPDDVFAGESREQLAVSALPEDVFAIEAREEVAALPADVFAAESRQQAFALNAEPVQLGTFPDDVFAPEIKAEPTVAVAVATIVEKPASALTSSTAVGGDMAAPQADRAGEASTAGRGPDHLTKAVSLTRDAAFAWMKLLSGPAVVTLTR